MPLSEGQGHGAQILSRRADGKHDRLLGRQLNGLVEPYNLSADGVGYCVFGKVVEGMDVADKIRSLDTVRDKPTKDAVIKSIRRQ